MSKSWRDVIKQVMFDKGINQLQLSHLINKSQSTVSHWMAGTRTPPLEEISDIMKHLEIKGIFLDHNGSFSLTQNTEIPIVKKDSYTVEVLNVQASAGVGVLVDTESIDSVRAIEFSLTKAHQIFGSLPANNVKILTVRGDSMSGTIEAGDLVFVDVSKSYYDGDGIYIFVYGDTLFVKRLQKVKDRLLVISDNKHYAQWEIFDSEMDQFFIQGKVLLSQTHKLNRHG